MGLFVIVSVVAIGALLKIVDANKKSQAIETSVNNMNFVLTSISLEMRVGTMYNCITTIGSPIVTLSSPVGCDVTVSPGTPWIIAFNSAKIIPGINGCNLIYAYHFDATSEEPIRKAQQTSCNDELVESSFFPLVSNKADSKITFTHGSIKVVTGGSVQPYAQFHFVGSAGVKEKNKTTFDVQTTVSQRLPD